MDASKFGKNSPGRIVTIPGNEIAFVPNPLPPAWDMPVELYRLLADAKQQIGILEGLGRTLPNPAILLRPIADREAIRSSSLEGTYATPKELLLFELEPRESTSERDPVNDHREVYNYRQALLHGTKTELPLSLRLIREMHRILLTGVRGRDKAPGEFRKIQVAIGSDRRFVPPPPEHVLDCLSQMESYLHNPSCYDPLVDCFLVHYQFETIHPFIDGNGRVGRLLLALMLQQKCELSKPWIYLSEYFDDFRDEYVHRLYGISTEANWNSWVEFCLNAVIVQTKATINRCDRLRLIREDFVRRINDVGGSVRLHQIVEDVFHSPYVRLSSLPLRLNVTYPTAKKDIDKLVGANILRELPNISPKTFYAPEVFNVAYEALGNSDDL